MISEALKRNKSELSNVNLDTDLREVGLDSITSIELIIMLENEFNIFVDDDDLLMDNSNTINKLTNMLERYIA